LLAAKQTVGGFDEIASHALVVLSPGGGTLSVADVVEGEIGNA